MDPHISPSLPASAIAAALSGRYAWLTLLGLLAASIVIGSVLAWPLTGVTGLEYERVLTRSVLLATALVMALVWRGLALTRQEVGFSGFNPRSLWLGWLVGIALIVPVTLVFVGLGFRVLDHGRAVLSLELVGFVFYAFATAWLVGLFEETLFRGVLQALFSRAHGVVVAAFVTSTLYASVHFLQLPGTAPTEITWWSGVAWAAGAFAPLAQPASYWDSFLPLLVLGLLLSWCRHATGSLLWCIAMHSAWVFFIRMLKELTVRDVVNPWAWLVGGYDHFVGLLVLAWLLLVAAVAWLARRPAPALGEERVS